MAEGGFTCHDQSVVNFSKVAGWMDMLHGLMGLASGALLVAVGVRMHRDGGSVGWPIAGTAVLILNSLWVARRQRARRRGPTPSS